MNVSIRRAGFGMIALFLALVAQLTYLQVVRADDLANDPGNIRIFLRDVTRARGPIVTADGVVLARSRPSNDQYERQRRYPKGTASLFSHVVGYQSLIYGNTGVENTYNDALVARDFELVLGNLTDVLSSKDLEGTVVLNLTNKAQSTAANALAGRAGTVVAVEVKTGNVVASYSNPTFDPNPLASHSPKVERFAFTALQNDPTKPDLARAWRERYPPGSTFKVVTTALALENGIATPTSPIFPPRREIPLPQSNRTLSNFGGELCGGNLTESFVHSCNTTFGELGLQLGERFATGIHKYGLNDDPLPADVNPSVVRSIGPPVGSFKENQPLFAYGAIGQADVSVTPLQMAMIAQAIGNGGVMMVPHVANRIEDPEGKVVRRIRPREWGRVMQPETAATVRDMMVQVVQRGTGTAAQIPGITVAGKTGTAQTPSGPPHAWFVSFAPAENPIYAVAVLVEHGGNSGSETTGGRVAAPIAKQMFEALLGGNP